MAERETAGLAHHRWTQTDITMLRARLGAGDALADVARVLERSPENVMLMMYRLRLAK